MRSNPASEHLMNPLLNQRHKYIGVTISLHSSAQERPSLFYLEVAADTENSQLPTQQRHARNEALRRLHVHAATHTMQPSARFNASSHTARGSASDQPGVPRPPSVKNAQRTSLGDARNESRDPLGGLLSPIARRGTRYAESPQPTRSKGGQVL